MSETKHFAGAYTVRFQLTIDEFLRNESPRRSHRPDYIVVHYDERIVAYIPVKPFFSAKYKKRGDAVRLERSVDAVFVESDAMSGMFCISAAAALRCCVAMLLCCYVNSSLSCLPFFFATLLSRYCQLQGSRIVENTRSMWRSYSADTATTGTSASARTDAATAVCGILLGSAR